MPHVVAVRKLTNFTNSKNVRSIQYHSFHGDAYRDVDKKLWTKASYYDDAISPLHLVRDGNRVPPITRPGLHFIVNEQLRATLAGFPHIRFEQVIFEKIVDFFYAKGDFNIYRDAERIYEQDLLRACPDVPKLHARVGSHHEVIVPRNSEVAGNFPDAEELVFNQYGRDADTDEPTLKLSERLVAEYPLQWHEQWYITSPAMYEALEPHIDFDFFYTDRIDY